MRQAFPAATLINGYGPTETVISPMLWEVAPGEEPVLAAGAALPIGTVVGARSAWVLDDAMNPVPAGMAGELYLGGEGLARGYHARAAHSAERFVPDPFGEPGARLYRTGDRARQRADGLIEYLGRLDRQIKLRGMRIELGEIEARLTELPGVREAAAAVHGEGAEARLVGYLAAQRGAVLDAAGLKAQLAARLPEALVPAQLVVLEALPVNGAGKVDRQALPAPAWQGRPYRAPEGEWEERVAAIWAEVLGMERVGRDDDFFALGGHSLLATQALARVRQRLALTVPLKMLFETPRLADFAAQLATHSGADGQAAIPRRASGAPVPLSPAQQGLWFLWRCDPHDPGYNIYSALRCRGALNDAALQAALDGLVARHAALRTTFRAGTDGGAEQIVHEPQPVALDRVDLSAHAKSERAAAELAEAESLAPFDLTAGPLLRARLVRLAIDDHLLLITVHHIVADGWSFDLIYDELAARYRAHCEGVPVQLPALSLDYADYADYAAWQRTRQPDPTDLAYWSAALAGMPEFALPAPKGAPALPGMEAEQHIFALDSPLAARARALAQQHGATLAMLLQAAFHVLLWRHTGAPDHCIGSLAATRDRLELEPIVGLFLNALPLRARIDPTQSFAALLAQVRQTRLAAQSHAALPFEAIVDAVQPARAPGCNPLFRVLFNFLRPRLAGLAGWPGLAIEDFPVPRRRVVFDLELDLAEFDDGRVKGAFSYARERIESSFVRALYDDYPALLATLLAEPDAPLAAAAAPRAHAADTAVPSAALRAEPPQPGPESELAALWSEVLGVADVGRHDNFFALGGSSLACLAVAAHAQKLGLALAPADLFIHQTVATLAAALATRADAPGLVPA